VLQLREAQRELRRGWTTVESAEKDLVDVETELGERVRGVDLLRQERRLRQALEHQRDALLTTLEERSLETEALEREHSVLQLRLERLERDADRSRGVRAALDREREVSLTARRHRAQVVGELRQRDALLAEIEGERDSLKNDLTEARARVDSLRTEADLRRDQTLSAATRTERFRRAEIEDATRAELEEAESERARLEEALSAESPEPEPPQRSE
jgi:chromosome segregation ATPase